MKFLVVIAPISFFEKKVYTLFDNGIIINKNEIHGYVRNIGNTNLAYSNFSGKEPCSLLRETYYDKDIGIDATAGLVENHSSYSDYKPFLSFTALVLASHFNSTILDLDAFLLRKRDTCASRKEILDDAIREIRDFDISNNTSILYSIMVPYSDISKEFLDFNLSVLKILQKKAKSVFLGGSIFRILSDETDIFLPYKIFKGKNLHDMQMDEASAGINCLGEDYSFSTLYIPEVDSKDYQHDSSRYAVFDFGSRCHRRCIFCVNNNINKRDLDSKHYRFDELKRLCDLGFNSFLFIDPHLSNSLIYQLADYVQKNNLRFLFAAGFVAQYLDDQNVKILKEIGLRMSFIGCEAADDNRLKYLRKDETLADIKHGIQLLHSAGVWVEANFITNLPYSDNTEVYKLDEFVSSFNRGTINSVRVNSFRYYPQLDMALHPSKYKLRKISSHYIDNRNLKEIEENRILGECWGIKYNYSRDISISDILHLYRVYDDKQAVYSEFLKNLDYNYTKLANSVLGERGTDSDLL